MSQARKSLKLIKEKQFHGQEEKCQETQVIHLTAVLIPAPKVADDIYMYRCIYIYVEYY